MNFSGNRYDRECYGDLAQPELETHVLSCKDRFGSYGVIGLQSLTIENHDNRFDVQLPHAIETGGTRISEHVSARTWLNRGDFHANYRKTPRNAPSGKVFEDIGMEEVETRDGVTSLVFRSGRDVPEDGVIEVVVQEQVLA